MTHHPLLTLRRHGLRPVLLVTVCLLCNRAAAATLIAPRNLGELARESDAVVLARATSIRTESRGALIFTYTELVADDVVSGDLAPGDLFTVQTPGGELDGEIWAVPGSPQLKPGTSYLLCLARKPDGVWLTAMLAHGLLEVRARKGGGDVLVPVDEWLGLELLPRLDGERPEPVATYDRDALIEHLREVTTGQSEWSNEWVRVDDGEGSDAGSGSGVRKAVPSGCVFFENGGRRFRWRAFDSGGSATMYADSNGDYSVPGGGFDLVNQAMNLWMDVTGTSLNLVFGGPREATLDCATQDSQGDLILFNDPCSDIADLQGCGGVLAFGGPRASGTHGFDGASWLTITSWIVVVNNGTGCLGSSNYRVMLAHELGHGLGFGHVADSGALMYASCCRNINATDRTCVRYAYPPINPANARPQVNAGDDADLILARNRLRLSGSVIDDGLPTTPGSVSQTWRQLAGPAGVSFDDVRSLEPTVTFPRSGTYVVGLTADDGQLLRTDEVQLDLDLFAGNRSVVRFQENAGAYRGTVDTYISESSPTRAESGAPELNIDADDPGGSGLAVQALLRFEEIFGNEEGQIPPGSTIVAARLELTTTNPGDGAALHRLVEPWTEDVTWQDLGGGIQPGVEAESVVDALAPATAETTVVDVTPSLAAWSADPCSNHGWALLPLGDDGWDFYSADGETPPVLEVEYEIAAEQTLIAVGDTWRFFKGLSEPSGSWTDPDFVPDARWLGGATGIGYGDQDDRTLLSDMQNRYVTIYCRREFTVGEPSAIGRLTLRIDYDDGFVAYLNGMEVARSASLGVPGSPISRVTLSASHEAGTPETYFLAVNRLRAGKNVLAIEVHNASVDSSDLSFIPELTTLSGSVDEGAMWSFLRGSNPVPAAWNQPEFDDSGWERGSTGIGYGDGDDGTVLDDMEGSYLTVFCRGSFFLPDPQDVHEVLLTAIYDDGVVLYVNGEELVRSDMPGGRVTAGTAAATGGESRVVTVSIPRQLLASGENLIAASVHNSSLTSSDLSFVPILTTVARPPRKVFCDPAFQRGDVNGDGGLDVSDPIGLLFHLLGEGQGALPCDDAADANDDGQLDIADPILIVRRLFLSITPPLPPPGLECGEDPTADALGDCATPGCAP